jgi:hypothetical protein
MMTSTSIYQDNILMDGLGDILDRTEVAKKILHMPENPDNVGAIPYAQRLHLLYRLRYMHLPRIEEFRIAESIDIALRQGYDLRNPANAETWSMLTDEPLFQPRLKMPAGVVSIIGNSGTGKTEAITRILQSYPKQLIHHPRFPRIAGDHWQVSWMSITIPASGRSIDMARSLMDDWQRLMAPLGKTFSERFEKSLSREKLQGQRLLEEWRKVAESHSLGILHIDEIQNLFKLQTLEKRRKAKGVRGSDSGADPGLPIIEDQLLKWILTLTASWSMPIILSGTPDGFSALKHRMATSQRLVSLGHHTLPRFLHVEEPEFAKMFFPALISYQLLANPLKGTPDVARTLLNLTAGIPRMLVALWICAQRIAIERRDDTFRLQDLHTAAKTYMAPVMPAIAALASGDPYLMAQFEDLLPEDWDIWDQLVAK